MFHSFTGCDTTSSFFGKEKESVWEAWVVYTEVTDAFNFIVEHSHAQLSWIARSFICWNVSQSLYMTRPALWCRWMKQERNFSARKNNDGEHSPNSTGPATAHQACSVPGWHLDNLKPGPTTDTNCWRFLSGAHCLRQQRLWMKLWRVPVKVL